MYVTMVTSKCRLVKILPSMLSVNPSPAEPGNVLRFANSIDPDQLASEEAN